MIDKVGYLKSLEIRKQNTAKISMKMKDYDSGIEPSIIDSRSEYEKQQDAVYIHHQLRDKIYKLFNNDPTYAEAFMDMMSNSQITPEKFNAIYEQLKLNFKGSVPKPALAMQNAIQLLDNF